MWVVTEVIIHGFIHLHQREQIELTSMSCLDYASQLNAPLSEDPYQAEIVF